MMAAATGYELALIYIYQLGLAAGLADIDIALWLETPSPLLPNAASPGQMLRSIPEKIIEIAENAFMFDGTGFHEPVAGP